jgi:hypothetical protein
MLLIRNHRVFGGLNVAIAKPKIIVLLMLGYTTFHPTYICDFELILCYGIKL